VKRRTDHAINARQRRAVLLQQGSEITGIAEQANLDTLSIITDIAFATVLLRQLPDKGAKTYPLNFTVYA
jgi:hypothetical protein